jgi:soluble lytic murein transglycosylase-like protein
MLSEIRLLGTFACLGLGLALGACTTTDPKLPQASSLPVPQPSPRTAEAGASQAVAAADSAQAGTRELALAPASKPAAASAALPAAFKAPDPALDSLISKYSVAYSVPESLVRRVVHRESRFNPAARNGPYWGLMQMLPATARGMGHKGSAKDLLDAETNLKYGVKYLAGAYMVADGNPDQAVRLYSRGYYYQAKRKGLLEETGLKPSSTATTKPAVMTAESAPAQTVPAQATPARATPAQATPAQMAYGAEPAAASPAAVPLPTTRP